MCLCVFVFVFSCRGYTCLGLSELPPPLFLHVICLIVSFAFLTFPLMSSLPLNSLHVTVSILSLSELPPLLLLSVSSPSTRQPFISVSPAVCCSSPMGESRLNRGAYWGHWESQSLPFRLLSRVLSSALRLGCDQSRVLCFLLLVVPSASQILKYFKTGCEVKIFHKNRKYRLDVFTHFHEFTDIQKMNWFK